MQTFVIKQRNSFRFFTFQLCEDERQIGDFSLYKYTVGKNTYEVNLVSAFFSKSFNNELEISENKKLKAHIQVTRFNSILMPLEKETIFILKKRYVMKPTGFGNLGMEVWDAKKMVAKYMMKGMLKKEDVIEVYEKLSGEELGLLIGILFYRHQYCNPTNVA